MDHFWVRRKVAAVVGRALREGVLRPAERCEHCGAKAGDVGCNGRPIRLHLHHWSYAREHWLDTIELCARCHSGVHHGRIPEPRTGRIYQSHVKERFKAAESSPIFQARVRLGLSRQMLARLICRSPSLPSAWVRIAEVEQGTGRLAEDEVEPLLNVLRLVGAERDAVRATIQTYPRRLAAEPTPKQAAPAVEAA
jgi:hypothetical protein